MATIRHLHRIVTFSNIILLILAANVRSEECTRDVVTVDCAKLLGNIIYMPHGKSINLYCSIKEDHHSGENHSGDLYFTRNDKLLSNELIKIINSTTIKLYVRKPPISESIYACRSKNSHKLIDWTAVVVGAKPKPVNNFSCQTCSNKSLICSWSLLENKTETGYDVTYSVFNESSQYVGNKCPNITFHKDDSKMSCIWKIDKDFQSNTTQTDLHFQLKIKNRFGITAIDKTYQIQGLSNTSISEYCPHVSKTLSSIIIYNQNHTSTVLKQEVAQPIPSISEQSPYKIVCYVDSEARTRSESTKFSPDDIDSTLCTHIVYADAGIHENNLTFDLGDVDLALHSNVTALKAKGFKVLLGFFGMSRPHEPKYLLLINDPVARKRFIENAVDFLEQNDFDGLEMISFFRKCWGDDCSPESNKLGFIELIRGLHDALAQKKMLLSMTIPGTKVDIDAGYDLLVLWNYLDWITIDTGIYQRGYKFTEHRAPLYMREEDQDPTANLNFTVHYVIGKGGDKSKYLIDMPALGELLLLSDSRNNGLHAPVTEGAFPTYYDMCRLISKEWTVVKDPEKRIGPYAYYGKYWISFDDTDMIKYKSEYVKDMGLGGAGVWFATDDFNNFCGCESYPILKATNRVLGNYSVPDPKCQFDV